MYDDGIDLKVGNSTLHVARSTQIINAKLKSKDYVVQEMHSDSKCQILIDGGRCGSQWRLQNAAKFIIKHSAFYCRYD